MTSAEATAQYAFGVLMLVVGLAAGMTGIFPGGYRVKHREESPRQHLATVLLSCGSGLVSIVLTLLGIPWLVWIGNLFP